MYQEQELLDIRSQQKRRWLILSIPALLLLVSLVASLILRQQVMTDVFTLLLGGLLIAGYDLGIKPLRCYERHLNNVLHGRIHELTCRYSHIDEEISLVDGVSYRAMTFITYDEKHKPFERMFYFDVQKPVPELPEGAEVRVVYHDHELADLALVGG